MKQKIITLLFAVIAFMGVKAATLAVVEGNCGENLTWTLNSKDSTLTIEGSGEMTSAPWSEYKLYVAYVTLPAELTNIFEGAFSGCSNVKQLTALSATPPAGGANSGINAPSCKLIIPQGCMNSYANAIWWEDFASIEEINNVVPVEYAVTTYANNGTVIGAGTYEEGTTVQLEAIPDEDFYFTQWNDGNTSNPRKFVITQDTSFYAYFDTDVTFTLTVDVNNDAWGHVSGEGTYKKNANAYLYADANVGYILDKWSDGITSKSRSVLMDKDQSFTAYFAPNVPGDNLTWSFDEGSGTLTISGTGDMRNWTDERDVPWYNNGTPRGFLPIRNVVIEEGVTSVGDYAFRKCSTIVSISLPSTLGYIGRNAFRNAGITSITIPANVTSIGSSVFYDCEKLQKVTVLAEVPPTLLSGRIFNTEVLTFYFPCGSLAAYQKISSWCPSSSAYRAWTYIEGAYDYTLSEHEVIVLQEPTCQNNGTLIIEAAEPYGFFFDHWNDGNTENPRTVQLNSNQHYEFVPEYIQGERSIVCKGYEFVSPYDEQTYIITQDTVIGNYYFFVKTSHKPTLSEDEYPIMQAGRLYYNYTEKALREKYSELNKNADKIETIEWAYSVSSNKTADTYIKSDVLQSDAYDFAWVKYSALTECGNLLADTMLVYAALTSEKPAASQLSTEGKDFWVSSTIVCPPDRYNQYPPTPYIAISAEKDCEVQITGGVNNSVHIAQTVSAGSWTEFREDQLDPAAWFPIHMYNANNVSSLAGQTNNYGLHITATENISVYVILSAVYAMDASNILPVTALGSEYFTQDYWAVAKEFTGVAGLNTILATEDGTVVDITPQGDTYDGHLSGEKYSVLLNQGQTYYLVSKIGGRLSGTHIQARKEKKIAVYCGVPLVNIPTGISARDCLFEQAFPVEYWGTQFIATRSLEKDGNFIGITAAEDGTEVMVDGNKLCTLDRGQTYLLLLQGPANPYARKPGDSPIDQVITADAIYIETSCPCEIYNYDTGNSFEGRENPTELTYDKGDPSSVWISPIQQKIERITFSTCYTSKTTDHFLNVIAETASCQQTRLTAMYGANPIDRTYLLEWQQVPGNHAYSYARAKIGDASTQAYSVFRLENSNGVIAHVYGNGNDESYAYSAGSATIKRAVELNGITHVGEQNEIESRFCLGDPIVLNAQVGTDEIDRIDWDFGDGVKILNGEPQVEHLYEKAGSYEIKAKIYTHKECPFTLFEPEEMTLQVQVGVPDTLRREYAICEGESFIYNGKIYSQATTDTIVYGCDSVEIVNLTINNCQVEVPDTIVVDPTENTADFIWPILQEAYTYTLTVWADADHQVLLCVLTFNAAGYLINIEFGSAMYANYSPACMPARKQKDQVIVVGTTTLDFTIIGLEENHTYYFELKAFDKDNNLLGSMSGSFTTGQKKLTGIEDVNKEETSIQKFLRDGQIFILRGDKTYTLTGQEVK